MGSSTRRDCVTARCGCIDRRAVVTQFALACICCITAILSVCPAVAVRLWTASVRYVPLLPPTPHQFLTESWIRSSTALRQIFLAHPVGRWLERAHISFLRLPSSRRGLLPGNLGWCPIM